MADPALCPDVINTYSCTRPMGQCPFAHTTYTCELCDHRFLYAGDLQMHVDAAPHQLKLASGNIVTRECVVCDMFIVTTDMELVKHQREDSHQMRLLKIDESDGFEQLILDGVEQLMLETVEPTTPGHDKNTPSNGDIFPPRRPPPRKHKRKGRSTLHTTSVEESAKDKFGVRVFQDQVDFGDIENGREFTFKCTFNLLVVKIPVVLTDVRMASTVSTFRTEWTTHFFPKFTQPVTLVLENLYELSIIFNPNGNFGRFSDRLELVFEDEAGDTQFVITRPVRANVVSSTIQELLAPIAPYVRPTLRSSVAPHVIDQGDKPPGQGKKAMAKLPEAKMPQSIMNLKDTGSVAQRTVEFQKMMPRVFKASKYGDHWKNLLWMEEHQESKCMAVYDQSNVAFARKEERCYFLSVPGLAERRPAVTLGDSILVQAHFPASNNWSRGFVHEIQQLQVGIIFHQDYHSPLGERINVRFELNRITYRKMHLAVASSFQEPRILFPTAKAKDAVGMSEPSVNALARRVPFFDGMRSNPLQWLAVTAIAELPAKSIPFVVFGPPGTGKTVVVVEAIRQILRTNPNAKIIACAPSNSAADIIAERLIQGKGSLSSDILFRLNAPDRKMDMDPLLSPYTLPNGRGGFEVPSAALLQNYRVVVTTCVTAYEIHKAKCPKVFTHILVDEAGQASEPEVMIPVKLVAGPQTNVILAGDPKQLGPIVRSAVGIKLGLDVSWLDRLMKLPLYDPTVFGGVTVVKLLHNFRSHNAILSYPNQEFYGGELQCRGDPAILNSCLAWGGLTRGDAPVVFHAIKGQDIRESSSPSFFNLDEISVVKAYIDELVEEGLASNMIGVITPYSAQCKKIRKLLENSENTDVKVGSAEQFQGDVRPPPTRMTLLLTCGQVIRLGMSLPFDSTGKALKCFVRFVSNPRRFNVAMTRAQALLIVVGDPDILGLDPVWRSFLHYVHNEGVWRGRANPWDPTEIPGDGVQRAQVESNMEDSTLRTRQIILNREILDEKEEDEPEAKEREAVEDQPVREAE